MSDIKTRKTKPKTVKILDKSRAWTERVKDSIVYTSKKNKDDSNNQTNIYDYGDNKIKRVSNRVKDGTIHVSKKIGNYSKDKIVNEYKKKKLIKGNSKDIKSNSNKIIKTSNKTNKAKNSSTKLKKIMLEEGKKLAIKSKKAVYKGIKVTAKAIATSIKGIIAGTKSLIGLLASCGIMTIIIVIVICLVGLLCGSVYGIFFSSEETGKDNIKMSNCIAELNTEMNNKIKNIKTEVQHDEIVINSNKAEWKEILAVYSVIVSNGNNEYDVMTIDEGKKSILKKIFWDMNSISYEVYTELYDYSNSIGFLGKNDNDLNNQKLILHININSKSLEEMKTIYNLNENQIKQLNELSSDEYLSLWNSVIYGVFSNSGDLLDWKQKGKPWSDIRIGTTNYTIGDIGCLATSIAILIKKSGVATPNITPFNPGTFVQAMNNNYGFDGYGNLQYATITKLVPDFQYVDKVELKNMSKSEKLNEIRKYYEEGYYMAAEVLGATEYAQHWIAIDNVTNNTIIMFDPDSDVSNLWDKYNWNNTTQFIYFKVRG